MYPFFKEGVKLNAFDLHTFFSVHLSHPCSAPCGCEGALTRQMIRVRDVFTINKSLDIYITTHHGSSLAKDGRDATITNFLSSRKMSFM